MTAAREDFLSSSTFLLARFIGEPLTEIAQASKDDVEIDIEFLDD